MPFTKLPLRQRIERTNSPHGFGWDEFQKIMRMPEETRPSVASVARMYGVDRKTVDKWIVAWKEEGDV
jgi:hypothetical protein